jgi:hypothetical protein
MNGLRVPNSSDTAFRFGVLGGSLSDYQRPNGTDGLAAFKAASLRRLMFCGRNRFSAAALAQEVVVGIDQQDGRGSWIIGGRRHGDFLSGPGCIALPGVT